MCLPIHEASGPYVFPDRGVACVFATVTPCAAAVKDHLYRSAMSTETFQWVDLILLVIILGILLFRR